MKGRRKKQRMKKKKHMKIITKLIYAALLAWSRSFHCHPATSRGTDQINAGNSRVG